LLDGSLKGDGPSAVSIEFRVKVPASTDGSESLYLSGNAEALGSWKPDGLRLDRSKDGTHGARVKLPRGQKMEFKVTRGSWRTVERALDGNDLPNRELRVDRDAIVEIEVASWEGGTASRRSTVTGVVREHTRLPSRHLGGERTVLVWLPPGYEKDAAARYPVLYLHDGQNVLDAATAFAGKEWRADESADRLIRDDRIRPLILVAIHNTPDRIAEYTPWRDAKLGGGKGDLHVHPASSRGAARSVPLPGRPRRPPSGHWPRLRTGPDGTSVNRWTVVCRYVWPGLRITDGNSGRLTESGKCCVSRQSAARFP
jgi:hypothetical protein